MEVSSLEETLSDDTLQSTKCSVKVVENPNFSQILWLEVLQNYLTTTFVGDDYVKTLSESPWLNPETESIKSVNLLNKFMHR